MAIYHYRVGFVSRSTGRSAVQSAAYISGTKLEESRRDITADYRNRSSDIIFSATFAPHHAPKHMGNLEVWNSLESFEDQYAMQYYKTEQTQEKYKSSAQVAQTTVVALPKELTPEVWQELVTDFVKERFVSRGLVATVAIHNDEGNPHAHFQISRRSVTEKGEWSRTKDREITTKAALIESRKLWAQKTNFYLSREGFDVQVDHRSYADLGVPFEPTKHESWFAHQLKKSDLDSRIIGENKEIKTRNKELLGLNPEEILKELCNKQATFSTVDLARTVQQRLEDDPKLAPYVYEKSLAQAAMVGISLDGQARYTSQEYIQLEAQALKNCDDLMHSKATIPIDKSLQETALKNQYQYLSSEQQQAVQALCESHNLSVLIGKAGAGKTTTLKAVIDLHRQSGYKICGLSLSATAAENLALETNCSAETVAFYLDKWDRREDAYQKFWSIHTPKEHALLERNLKDLGQYSLTPEHLIIVDEAGMIGTKQWASILSYVEKAKAKLIVVGDNHQFKAIESGDFFRKLTEKNQDHNRVSQLNTIIRQKEDWMKVASQDLSEFKTHQALASYEQHGHIQSFEKDNLQSIAETYVNKRMVDPEANGLILASTRAECKYLNDEIRKLLKENNFISASDTEVNGRLYAVGDEVIFLKNDRDGSITGFDEKANPLQDCLVKNGTRGKIVSINECHDDSAKSNNPTETSYQFIVEIDPNTQVHFNTKQYNHFDHSYATTLHKAQGQTADWSMVIASKHMDAHATYVALTRHRKEVTLFYDSKVFAEFKDLQKSLSRISNKDLVIDYTISPEHQASWENVQKYLLLGQDLATVVREKDWVGFQDLKNERTILGQTILADWNNHLSYAHQAGLSQESIEIASGLKMRPLSLIEEQARLTMQAYSKKAMEARLLWNEIRKTHPGQHCYEHSKYSDFSHVRLERNALAKEIVNNRSLYKEYVSKFSRESGIGWKTLNNQANQEFHHLLNSCFIQETLSKYGLEKPSQFTTALFIKHVQKLVERMPLWNNVFSISTLKIEERKLFEKAIIAEAVKAEAKREYCFLSTPLEAAIRSEGIALVTANLIQEKGDTQNLRCLLEKSVQIYDDQFNKQTIVFSSKSLEPNEKSSIAQLNALIYQQNKDTILYKAPCKSKELNLEL